MKRQSCRRLEFPKVSLPMRPPFAPMEARQAKEIPKALNISTNRSGTASAASHFVTAKRSCCSRKLVSH